MQNEITELRNQVRTLKRIVYGFGCLLVAGIVVGATSLQTVPDVIYAKKFVVINDKGEPVTELYANKDGGYLTIANNDGKPIASITGNENGGVFGINNNDGENIVQMIGNENGGEFVIINNDRKRVCRMVTHKVGGSFEIFNNDGKLVANLSATEFGGMSQIRNNDENPVCSVGSGTDGRGSFYMFSKTGIPFFDVNEYASGGVLQLNDEEGKTIVALGAMNELGGGLDILNKDTKPVARIYITKDGCGMLEVSGKDGMPCAEIGVSVDGGMVGLQFRDGKPGGGFAVMKEVGGTLLTINREGEITSITPALPELP